MTDSWAKFWWPKDELKRWTLSPIESVISRSWGTGWPAPSSTPTKSERRRRVLVCHHLVPKHVSLSLKKGKCDMMENDIFETILNHQIGATLFSPAGLLWKTKNLPNWKQLSAVSHQEPHCKNEVCVLLSFMNVCMIMYDRPSRNPHVFRLPLWLVFGTT